MRILASLIALLFSFSISRAEETVFTFRVEKETMLEVIAELQARGYELRISGDSITRDGRPVIDAKSFGPKPHLAPGASGVSSSGNLDGIDLPKKIPGYSYGSKPNDGGGRYYDPSHRPSTKDQWIEPYTRSDGTQVKGHYRTKADGSFWNNYSSQGNVNPYTGRVGTKTPPGSSAGKTYVRPYYRKDGTYVRGHYRSK